MRNLNAFSFLAGISLALVFASPVIADRPTDLYQTIYKTDTKSVTHNDTVLWTPASGNRIVLQGVLVSSNEAVDVELEVSNVDVVPPISLGSPGSQLVGGGSTPIAILATDAVLTWSANDISPGTGGNVSVMCWGWEDSF